MHVIYENIGFLLFRNLAGGCVDGSIVENNAMFLFGSLGIAHVTCDPSRPEMPTFMFTQFGMEKEAGELLWCVS